MTAIIKATISPSNSGDFQTLTAWLNWLESLQPEKIELGLNRVRVVYQRLKLDLTKVGVVVVAGTNGKGSTIAGLENLYHLAGYKTLAYTSPHLLRYNERIRIDAGTVTDKDLMTAFEAVRSAQEDTELTYFEFGTLAAIWLIHRYQPDIALLEVGLGGRLDAVNIIDADVAIITSIDLDHMDWLGSTRAAISVEKAGVARPHCPLVCIEPDPPINIKLHADEVQANLLQLGEPSGFSIDYSTTQGLLINTAGQRSMRIKLDTVLAPHQARNIAAVSIVASLADVGLPKVLPSLIESGTWVKRPPARLQLIQDKPEIWVDVAHNPAAAKALVDWLQQQPKRHTVVALGMLKDKDTLGVVDILDNFIDEWLVLPTDGVRGQSTETLADKMALAVNHEVTQVQSLELAIDLFQAKTNVDCRLLICGSFDIAAKALQWANVDAVTTGNK